MFDIPILPHQVSNKRRLNTQSTGIWPLPDGEYYSGSNARSLLNTVLNKLDLSREDTITILTTTQHRYVSTCVSVTSFNYGSISRVIVPSTKVCIVIHEHGYFNSLLSTYIEELRSKGIIIIEDCAHVMGTSQVGDQYSFGTLGDYALYSLPKLIDTDSGGLLVDRSQKYHLDLQTIENPYKEYKPLDQIDHLNSIRYKLFDKFVSALPHLIYPVSSDSYIPWSIYLKMDPHLHTKPLSSVKVEYFPTLEKNICIIPINPFVEMAVYDALIDELQQLTI